MGRVNKRIKTQQNASRMYCRTRYENAITSCAKGVSIRTRATRNSISMHVVSEARPLRVVLVHARVARFDGLLYAITLPDSQSASLSVRFKMRGQPSAP